MTAPKPKPRRKPMPGDRLAGGKTRDVAVQHTTGVALGPPKITEFPGGAVQRVLEGCVYTPDGIVGVTTMSLPTLGNHTRLVFCHKGRLYEWESSRVEMTRDSLVLAAGQFVREVTRKKRKPKEPR